MPSNLNRADEPLTGAGETAGIENPLRFGAERKITQSLESPDHPPLVEFLVFHAFSGVFSLDSSRIAGLRLAHNRLIIRFLWSVLMVDSGGKKVLAFG